MIQTLTTVAMDSFVDICSLFGDNTGSAVLLRNSLLYVNGEVTFVRNQADIGAAINIQEGSRVSLTQGLT